MFSSDFTVVVETLPNLKKTAFKNYFFFNILAFPKDKTTKTYPIWKVMNRNNRTEFCYNKTTQTT